MSLNTGEKNTFTQKAPNLCINIHSLYERVVR